MELPSSGRVPVPRSGDSPSPQDASQPLSHSLEHTSPTNTFVHHGSDDDRNGHDTDEETEDTAYSTEGEDDESADGLEPSDIHPVVRGHEEITHAGTKNTTPSRDTAHIGTTTTQATKSTTSHQAGQLHIRISAPADQPPVPATVPVIKTETFVVAVTDPPKNVKRPEMVPRRGSLSSRRRPTIDGASSPLRHTMSATGSSNTTGGAGRTPPLTHRGSIATSRPSDSVNRPGHSGDIGSTGPGRMSVGGRPPLRRQDSDLTRGGASKKKKGFNDPMKARRQEGSKKTPRYNPTLESPQDPAAAVAAGADIHAGAKGEDGIHGGVAPSGPGSTGQVATTEVVTPDTTNIGEVAPGITRKKLEAVSLWPDMSDLPVDADEAVALEETRKRAARRAKQEKFRQSFDPQDWGTYILTLHATVVQTVYVRVLVLFVVALAISIWNHYEPFPALTNTPHLVSGGALSLLIVFRTNSSYGRFWEGRDVFGRLFAQAIDTVRQAQLWIQAPIRADGSLLDEDIDAAEDIRNRFARFLTVFPFAVKQEIRQEDLQELETLWDDPAFLSLIEMGNIPNSIIMAAAQSIRHAVAKGYLTDSYAVRLDSGLSALLDSRAAAEKISSTPVPYVFAVEGSRFLSVFLITLPVVIVHSYGWGTPFVVALMSYFFLAVEAVGSEVEDPFGQDFNDIPLDNMCDAHREDVFEMMAFGNTALPQHSEANPSGTIISPQPISPTSGYGDVESTTSELMPPNYARSLGGSVVSMDGSVDSQVEPGQSGARLSAVRRLRGGGARRHSFINVDEKQGDVVVIGRGSAESADSQASSLKPAHTIGGTLGHTRRHSLQPGSLHVRRQSRQLRSNLNPMGNE